MLRTLIVLCLTAACSVVIVGCGSSSGGTSVAGPGADDSALAVTATREDAEVVLSGTVGASDGESVAYTVSDPEGDWTTGELTTTVVNGHYVEIVRDVPDGALDVTVSCLGQEATASVPARELKEDDTDYQAPPTKAEYKATCKKIAYRRLNKDADMLVGKKVRLHGQVFQIQDAGPGMYTEGFPGGVEPRTMILLAVTNDGYGYWDDNVAVAYEGRLAKVYEDDIITVWGKVLGQYSYESVAGYNMTVPSVQAKYVAE